MAGDHGIVLIWTYGLPVYGMTAPALHVKLLHSERSAADRTEPVGYAIRHYKGSNLRKYRGSAAKSGIAHDYSWHPSCLERCCHLTGA